MICFARLFCFFTVPGPTHPPPLLQCFHCTVVDADCFWKAPSTALWMRLVSLILAASHSLRTHITLSIVYCICTHILPMTDFSNIMHLVGKSSYPCSWQPDGLGKPWYTMIHLPAAPWFGTTPLRLPQMWHVNSAHMTSAELLRGFFSFYATDFVWSSEARRWMKGWMKGWMNGERRLQNSLFLASTSSNLGWFCIECWVASPWNGRKCMIENHAENRIAAGMSWAYKLQSQGRSIYEPTMITMQHAKIMVHKGFQHLSGLMLEMIRMNCEVCEASARANFDSFLLIKWLPVSELLVGSKSISVGI